jgi:hypothetical protein
MKVGPVLILVLFICSIAQSQTRHESGASAANSLTVTATVAPSVWLVMEPDGRQDMVVANAPDSKESFSHSSAKAHRKSPGTETKFFYRQTATAATEGARHFGPFRFSDRLKAVRRDSEDRNHECIRRRQDRGAAGDRHDDRGSMNYEDCRPRD